MAVMARETWTDERLDDLVKQVDKGFDETKLEIRGLRAEMDKGFDRVDADIREVRADMKKGFDSMNSRFDSIQQTMIIGFITLFASSFASVIVGVFAVLALT